MVYVGFGIIAASLSVLIYRHRSVLWSRLLVFWKGNHDTRPESLGSPQISEQVPRESDIIKAKEEVLVLQERVAIDHASKSYQLEFDFEEAKIRNGTPTPSLTLNDAKSTDENYASASSGPLSNNFGDLSLKMGSESTSPPEQLEQKSSESMHLQTPQSQILGRPSQASTLIPTLSQPSPNSSTPRSLPIPPTPSQVSDSALMPPPIRPSNTSTIRPLPKSSASLRPPPSAAAGLRVPLSRSPAALSPSLPAASASTSTLAPSKRSSKKVLLDPGHSPLDWAYLTRHPPTSTFLRGDSVPSSLIRVPPSLLRHHNGRKGKDAWGVWQGKVYNLTPYMKFHPGGVDELMKAAGRETDGQRLFLEIHPWVSWESMLSECLVGILVGEGEDDKVQLDEGGAKGILSLDEMD